ncbi:MAG TPA: transposase [Myxococcales bacterium]|nr:transposase [Myxococcales bacterium]
MWFACSISSLSCTENRPRSKATTVPSSQRRRCRSGSKIDTSTHASSIPAVRGRTGHNESFNGIFRDGCLNRWLFESVREAREATEHWLYEYNFERPHESLSGRSPEMFFKQGEQH